MLGLYVAWRIVRHLRHLIALALLCALLYGAFSLTALRRAQRGRGPLGPTVSGLKHTLEYRLERLHHTAADGAPH